MTQIYASPAQLTDNRLNDNDPSTAVHYKQFRAEVDSLVMASTDRAAAFAKSYVKRASLSEILAMGTVLEGYL